MRARVGGVAAAVISLALGGCGGDDGDDLDLAGDRTPVSITAPTSSSSLADQAEPPPLDNVGEDFEAIVASIHQFEEWLLGHPSSPMGTEIYQPGSPASAEAFAVVVEAVQAGTTIRVQGSEVRSVEVLGRPDDATVDLRYTDVREAIETVDAETGEVVERVEFDPDEVRTFDVRLRRGFDDRWRIETLVAVT